MLGVETQARAISKVMLGLRFSDQVKAIKHLVSQNKLEHLRLASMTGNCLVQHLVLTLNISLEKALAYLALRVYYQTFFSS